MRARVRADRSGGQIGCQKEERRELQDYPGKERLGNATGAPTMGSRLFLFHREQVDGIHGQLLADPGADEAADALVFTNMDRGGGLRADGLGDGLDAVHEAVIHTGVASRAVILDDGNQPRSRRAGPTSTAA